MARGRGRLEWDQTSSLLAMQANIHRNPKRTKVFMPRDFNPYLTREEEKPIAKTKDLSILKRIFVDNQQVTGPDTGAKSQGPAPTKGVQA